MRRCTVDDVADLVDEIREIRRAIHGRPELAYAETETAGLVADRLAAWGFSVTRGLAGTGVVGTLRVGEGSRSIGLRADMDALPITEATGLPYASGTPGAMHACGHDGHTAILLGAARQLARTRAFDGTVHLFFQPAEEIGHDSGASRMIADGLFERFPCDAVFGIHTHPGIPSGTFLVRRGPFMAASDKMTIEVDGTGGHAGRPHLAVDAALAAAGIVTALQSVVARNIDPLEPAVVSVGVLHAGDVYNVVPGSARIELSIRSFDARVRDRLRTRLTDLAQAQAASYGATARVAFEAGYPVLANADSETDIAAAVAAELVGEAGIAREAPPMMTSEDFAFMLRERPGCFLRLGNGIDSPPVHHSGYDFDDANLAVGMAFWTRLVERFLPA
ncbi:M20 aminoacylase family protein [Methylobacterium sp. OT2]|uniref:M20 aminoacylase family protein n=1 Tax=Methylobacterium sp. OT2 TaxID=2813779 RepID=UPI00197BAF5F|nr:M20 aminoacylase family protein [Methylobacterium sp. OT2]MBN4095999.1 amidohydrolase [Methylobacterium sp. OT2]